MRTGNIPFKFDLSDITARIRRAFAGHVGGVRLSVPFLSFQVNPTGVERKQAREVMIRLKDRRVLSSFECCDSCIDQALASLQEIRGILVDQQVALSDLQDGPLFMVLETMAAGIRQFLSFEQRLRQQEPKPKDGDEFYRDPEIRQTYFDALEMLRGHLSHCATQVAAIAGMEAPSDGLAANYQGDWQIEAYDPPRLTEN